MKPRVLWKVLKEKPRKVWCEGKGVTKFGVGGDWCVLEREIEQEEESLLLEKSCCCKVEKSAGRRSREPERYEHHRHGQTAARNEARYP